MIRKFTLLFCLVFVICCLSCGKSSNEAATTTQPPAVSTPTISSFSPATAASGTTVTITGTNFTGASAVTFGGTPATSFSVTNATTITAVVGAGTSGDVKVTTSSGTGSKGGFVFTSKAPAITTASATTGTTGSVIKLTGINFTGATAVTFGGTAASAFTVESNTSIAATVGSGSSGDIKVTTPDGVANFGGFTYISPIALAKLPDMSGRADVGLGFPRKADRQKTTGTVKVSVIFVDFSDAPATRTPQSVYGLVSPTTETFINTASYGKLSVVFEPKMKWYRMSKLSTAYNWMVAGFDYRGYLQEAVNLAESEVDFSQSDQILVLTNPDAAAIFNGPTFTGTSSFYVTADSKHFPNAFASGRDLLAWQGFWFSHEFGHSMGLADLYAYSGEGNRFVGNTSIMGNILAKAQDYNAWEKWLLGWITDDQVRSIAIPGTGSVELTPLEVTGGLKMVVLPIDATTALFIEDRRALGYDRNIPKQGPFVYLIDTKIASGNGVLKLLPINEADTDKLQLALSVGQTITYGSITLKCVASGAGGSTIEYERK